jgi:uncharacterized membrane protein
MLYKIAVALVILWMLGILFGYAMGGIINILLVLAVIMVIIDVRRKRSVREHINASARIEDPL